LRSWKYRDGNDEIIKDINTFRHNTQPRISCKEFTEQFLSRKGKLNYKAIIQQHYAQNTISILKFSDKINFFLAKEESKTYEKVVQLMNIVQAFGILPFKYMERVTETIKKKLQATSAVINRLIQL
jgi:hypothetical protein